MLETKISHIYKSEIAHPKSEILPTFTSWQKQKPFSSVKAVEHNQPNGWDVALRVVNGTLSLKKWFSAMMLRLRAQGISKPPNRVRENCRKLNKETNNELQPETESSIAYLVVDWLKVLSF
jgi:hypothetical protein